MEKLDGVSLGPLGKHCLLRYEAVGAIRGALVQDVLGTLVAASGFVVVIWYPPVAFRSESKNRNRKVV